jgi:hypothetical protein
MLRAQQEARAKEIELKAQAESSKYQKITSFLGSDRVLRPAAPIDKSANIPTLAG